jgi:hypothetical protein
MDSKRKFARWLLELAVVDYCAWMSLRNGVTIEVVSDGEES